MRLAKRLTVTKVVNKETKEKRISDLKDSPLLTCLTPETLQPLVEEDSVVDSAVST